MPLKVIIVGAGIGGLCAAVALHQAGHEVQILEKSRFAGEIGAALIVTPNGARVLRTLGFSFARSNGDRVTEYQIVDSETLAKLQVPDVSQVEALYGNPLHTMHRADMHTELMRLATNCTAGEHPVKLTLSTKVRSIDALNNSVELADGTLLHADLIIGADGVHSVARTAVLGDKLHASRSSGMSSFRFQIETEKLANDPHWQALVKIKVDGINLLLDRSDKASLRRFVWFDCRGGTMQTFCGIYPATHTECRDDCKEEMLQEFANVHPDILHLLEVAEEVCDWPLLVQDPLPHWWKGNTVLIGDAAHPMLPFGGQGANQAIEDAGALGAVFKGVHDPSLVPTQLRIFESVRRLQASRVQTLSKAMIGREADVEQELRKYAEPEGSSVPTTFPQRQSHDYGHNVFERCREVMQGAA